MAWERVRAASSEPASHGRNIAMCLAAVAAVALLGSTMVGRGTDVLRLYLRVPAVRLTGK